MGIIITRVIAALGAIFLAMYLFPLNQDPLDVRGPVLGAALTGLLFLLECFCFMLKTLLLDQQFLIVQFLSMLL